MKFDKEYTQYWASTINKSIDGTIIAGNNEAKYFLDLMSIKDSASILDLGCSFGRMFEVLNNYSKNISGVDPDEYAVEEAKKKEYIEVLRGRAEETGFRNSLFDLIFCWATFDVVHHSQGLKEFNRVLKNNGSLLVTGKNSNYYEDDILAFKAEKNAYLKDFPNRFTNLNVFLGNLEHFGFNLESLYLFPRRGDFGILNFELTDDVLSNSYTGYEYLIICKKQSDVTGNINQSGELDQAFSETAYRIAKEKGFKDVKSMFKSIGLD